MEEVMLDMECAKVGEEIAKAVKDEAVIRDALGVLQENGVYAFFLFLKQNKEGYEAIHARSYGFLKDKRILGHIIGEEADSLKAIREKFKGQLYALLFAKEILERVLIYARYHAKAVEAEKEKKEKESELEGV
jgi:hypothetical protein